MSENLSKSQRQLTSSVGKSKEKGEEDYWNIAERRFLRVGAPEVVDAEDYRFD